MPGRMRQEARPAGIATERVSEASWQATSLTGYAIPVPGEPVYARVASKVAWVVVLVLVFGPPMAVAFLAGCEYQARQLERLHGRRLS